MDCCEGNQKKHTLEDLLNCMLILCPYLKMKCRACLTGEGISMKYKALKGETRELQVMLSTVGLSWEVSSKICLPWTRKERKSREVGRRKGSKQKGSRGGKREGTQVRLGPDRHPVRLLSYDVEQGKGKLFLCPWARTGCLWKQFRCLFFSFIFPG